MKKKEGSMKINNIKKFINYSRTNSTNYLMLLSSIILFHVLSIFTAIIIPKIIVFFIEHNIKAIEIILSSIIVLQLIWFIFTSISNILKDKLKVHSNKIFLNAYADIGLYQTRKKYDEFIDAKNLNAIEGAKYGLWVSSDLSMRLEKVISSIIIIITSLVTISYFDIRLIFIPILIEIMLLPLYKKIRKIDIKTSKRILPENRAFSWYCRLIADTSYIKDIKLFLADDLVIKRYDELSNRIYKINQEASNKKGLILSSISFILQFAISIMLLLIVYHTENNTISDFILLFGVINASNYALNDIVTSISILKKTDILLQPFIDIIDSNFKEEEKKKIIKRDSHTIEFKNISFRYPNQTSYALNDISFKTNSTESIAIVGTNGAGKTTLVKLLCRFYKPESGEILFDGININQFNMDEWHRNISTLFQDFKLLPIKMSENIKESSYDENLFISPLLSDYFINPSGGEMQMMALLRAVQKKSPIYIFDEPTTNLDIMKEKEAMDLFKEHTKDQISIMISHRLSHTKSVDRIIVMDEGKIIEDGTHQSLIKKDSLYKKMYEKQIKRCK